MDLCLDVVGGGLAIFVVVNQLSVGTVVAGPVTLEVVDSLEDVVVIGLLIFDVVFDIFVNVVVTCAHVS